MNFPKNLSLKEKIHQMFILGFSGSELCNENLNVQKAINEGLGGIILFSENIDNYNQVKELTKDLQNLAKTPLFISIDQEGGKIERTINIKNKINYYFPRKIAQFRNNTLGKIQAEIMSKELSFMGVNMNFAPVLDVNTNKNNPVIGDRAFGDNPDTVNKYAEIFYKTFMKNSIIPVVKHFPGHGHTGEDSHNTLPVLDLSFDELEKIHIKPFIKAINNGVNSIMVNHVHYKIFDKAPTPASLSKNIINNYLKNTLGFNGLVFSDDMIMGGVRNYFDPFRACLQGINSGVDVFIYRHSFDENIDIIQQLYKAVLSGELSEKRIDESVSKIISCKNNLKFNNNKHIQNEFNAEKLQAKLDGFSNALY